ncbi:ABC transporter ATP-binding protein [Gulosibacter molinativorax]|uniref:ABC transporter ATP-binding protein n=1 Tax=Gulosibacter molinativorax TaxID=256821 RepID=A0ABT7C9B5_9MICO|nr:ABC transporter ATP-binding protein [Gulosibacter molinativorax]MDJ1371337.1 ABC transporter ATP-binding protein [Gulosibacter molinativorax]QUY63599.1 ABC transporter transmembrane region family protein [Gulosibacter molinativorax]
MLWKLLVQYLRPSWRFVVGVLVFQFLQALGALYLPTLNADIINKGVAVGDVGYIWRTGSFMLLVAFLQVVANIIAIWCGARAAMRAGQLMRRDVFDHVGSFSEREISQFGAGSLITRNTNDVQQVQMLIFMTCTMMVSAPMLAIGGVIMALRQDVGLSWIIAAAAPILLLFVGFIVWRMVPLFSRYQERLDNINRVLREQLSGIRVIRAFVREDIERDRFKDANEKIMETGRRVGNLFVVVFPGASMVMNLAIVAVIWFGGMQVDQGDVQIGSLFAYISYVMQILMGVIMVSFLTMMIPRAAVCADRIGEVLATDSSLKLDGAGIATQPQPGLVEFERVSFAYPGAEHPVLEDVNFRAEPGETVAVIGSTGSGKTTLVNLVPRLFDATSGEVRVGGVPVKDAEPATLWGSIGLVPQRPFLFSGTVASNLEFGREGATEEEMWAALEIAQAADFVREMPGALDAKIAQGGTNVSGGQRQRLSIARAIIHQPKLLVFDDSFSALDLTTDAKLRAALWRELPEVTKLVVAQRVSTIIDADRIIVLDDGRIVGTGTHDELLESNTTYQEIVESQLSAEAQA